MLNKLVYQGIEKHLYNYQNHDVKGIFQKALLLYISWKLFEVFKAIGTKTLFKNFIKTGNSNFAKQNAIPNSHKKVKRVLSNI